MKKCFILLSSALLLGALTFSSCGTAQKPAEEAKTECCKVMGDKDCATKCAEKAEGCKAKEGCCITKKDCAAKCAAKKDSCKHVAADTTKCATKPAAETNQ